MEIFLTGDIEIKTIRELIDRMAQFQPEAPFLISPETGRVLSFHGLQEKSLLISAQLRQSGLERGDKVAFLLDNGLFTAQLFLGAMYGGFVSVPLNVRAGVSQLSCTLDHCDAKAVFVGDEYSQLIQEVMAKVQRAVQVIRADLDGSVASLDSGSSAPPPPAPAPEDPALLMYTSGSTGQPKAAVHSHRTILAQGRNSIASHQLTATDRSLLVLPLYHINAECVTLIPTLLSGGSVVVPHRFSVSQFWDWLDEHRCTWSALVPTIISQLLDWKDPKADSRQAAFSRIRFLRSSSAPLSPSLHREFLDKFKLLLIQAMGSTECGNIFSNPLPPGENKIGSPGLPWGFEARIIDREGAEVPPGEPGEILLRGPAIMQGYYKEPEGTAAVLDPDGWLHTGDLAYRDPDGYFFVVGRSKELIIKGGVNIAPKQIDEVLESHPAVLEAAAVGVPDRYVGEDLVAFVVLRSGMTGDERELLAFCESRLGPFKTPTRIHFAKDLPKGPSGKVQRLRLLEDATLSTAQVAQAGSSAIVSSLEGLIADAWAQVLPQSQVDTQDNFFALGGHSLLAIQCLSRLREKLPISLSLSDFFENATVAQQAALIRRRLRPDDGNVESAVAWEQELLRQLSPPTVDNVIPLRDRSLPGPLSPAQQRIWFMEQLNAGKPVYNESEAVALRGELNVVAMEKAMNAIIARHEILRTTIQATGEEPVALVHESWPLTLKQIDLSSLPPAQRQAEVDRLLIDEPRLPYRLETEPGIRVTLLRLGPREHVLILMMHHIVCDWSSEGVLWRELSALYRAGCRGQPLALPVLPIQHGDYAEWQHQQTTDASLAADLAFWEQNLRGAPDLLELPTDRPRSAINAYRGARQRFRIPSTLVQSVRDCSQREKISLFTFFTAALDTLLYRYTGQEDILLGIPLADRDRPELQSVIGFLLHTHVLRTQLSGDMSFRELLTRVQKGVLDLYAHRAAPFDQIVSRVRPQRNLSYSPLFQVMINWRDRDQQLSFIGLDGLEVESLLAESRTAKFDLTFMLTDDEKDIWLEVEYGTDLFDQDRIERMAGHYRTVLEAAAADCARCLADLPLLTQPERHQILAEWNQTQLDYPKQRCLHDLIEEQAERTPDGVAVVFEDKQLTYRQLNDDADRLATHLQDLGVGADSLIGICVGRSPEMLVALLGILKAGGAYVPLDPKYPKDRLAFILEDAKPKALVTQQRLQSVLPFFSGPVVCLDAVPRTKPGSIRRVTVPTRSANLAYVLYTSGSTGRPKGVAIEHRSAVAFAAWAQTVFTKDEFAGVLGSTSICFDLSVFELLVTLVCGGKVILAENALNLPELVAANEVRLINTVPSAIAELATAGGIPSSVTTVNLAGEPLPQSLVDRLYRQPSIRKVYDLYGPTESTTYSTWTLRTPGGRETIGRPIANTRVYILDRRLQPVPVGVTGELYIGGDGLAREYLCRPEMTLERFIADPFDLEPGARLYKTGDLARYLPNGAIEYLGRLDYQVKIRGFRIELGEIESLLAQHPAVQANVVVARQDTPGDHRLAAYIVSRNGALPASDLREYLRAKVPEYMIPAAFVAMDELPLTPNGKVDRKALPVPGHQAIESADTYVAPRTPTEEILAEIWAETLCVDRVGVQDSFFDRGGHSLLALQLLSRVEAKLGKKPSLAAFFQNPTAEKLATLLTESDELGLTSNVATLRSGRKEAPLFLFYYLDNARQIAKHFTRPVYFIGSTLERELRLWEETGQRTISIEELARRCVADLQTVQPRGPYRLAGFCLAGVLAVEIAHQLIKAGEQVAMLGLLDSSYVHGMKPAARSGWQARWWFHTRELFSRGPGYLSMKLSYRRKLKDERRREAIDLERYEARVRPFLAEIVRAYRCEPYAGNAVLVRAAAGAARSFETKSTGNGWETVMLGQFNVENVDCDHDELLQASHVAIAAKILEKYMVASSVELTQFEIQEAGLTNGRFICT